MADRIIKVLACDPGITSFGYSLLEYNTSTGHTTVVKYGTITGKSLLKQQKELQDRFENKYIVLWELEKILMTMFAEYCPDHIVTESAFSHTFLQAYAALILVIQTIRTASMRTFGRDIYLIAPRESKKAVSDDGNANKQSVQDAIFRNPDISIKVSKNNQLDGLTEHAYDSIAAGIAFIKGYLPSILAR